ncbi:MAG: hypothetical protein COA99_10150 [Moraxellaceae bacterium]|nr:MAG: hypothetical protein COA99_10150 [Moraxellaceae bacterium]
MLIKALLLVALIVAIVTLIKRGQQKNHHNPVQPPSVETVSDTETMKRCAECGVHLPEKEAISYQTLHFCCNEHKKAYLQDKDT